MECRISQKDEIMIACCVEEETIHLELQAGEGLSLSLFMMLPAHKERNNTDE